MVSCWQPGSTSERRSTDLALRYQSHLASDGSQATTPEPSSGSPRWVATTLPFDRIDCQTDFLGRPSSSPPNQTIGRLYDGSSAAGGLPLMGELGLGDDGEAGEELMTDEVGEVLVGLAGGSPEREREARLDPVTGKEALPRAKVQGRSSSSSEGLIDRAADGPRSNRRRLVGLTREMAGDPGRPQASSSCPPTTTLIARLLVLRSLATLLANALLQKRNIQQESPSPPAFSGQPSPRPLPSDLARRRSISRQS